MNIFRAVKLALRTLGRNRLRSFFMMLGMVVGIASLTALSSVGESTKQETMRQWKRMVGTFDTVVVRPGAAQTKGMPTVTNAPPTLKFDDAEAIARDVPEARRVGELQNAFDVDVKYRDKSTSTGIFGASIPWMDMHNDEIAEGNAISDDDIELLGRVAVIGLDVKNALFGGDDPIGKTVRIGDIPFQVKGVLATRGSGPSGGSLDNMVLIPVTTTSRRLFNRDFLTMVNVQLKDASQSAEAVKHITALLRERHHIVPPATDDFTISNTQASMARVLSVGSTLSKVLSGVATLATLIGGVVIMSLMLIAVSERRKEIGVRRSVGASRQDIMFQFLLEALTMSAVGGLLGVAIGVGGTSVANWLEKLPPALVWNTIGGAVVISIGVGLVFGLHPAWKASNVDPIAALRS